MGPAGTLNLNDVSAIAFDRSDALYLTDAGGRLYRSSEIGAPPQLVGLTGHQFTGLSFSPATGVLWGTVRDSFYTINPTTASTKLVSTTGWDVQHSSIAFNPPGGMYVLYGNVLLAMDRASGQVTEIGETGDDPLVAIAMRDDVLADVDDGSGRQNTGL